MDTPPPRSPERIKVLPHINASYLEDLGTTVTFTVQYEEWCCAEAHELSDAIATVVEILEEASARAKKERLEAIATRRDDETSDSF